MMTARWCADVGTLHTLQDLQSEAHAQELAKVKEAVRLDRSYAAAQADGASKTETDFNREGFHAATKEPGTGTLHQIGFGERLYGKPALPELGKPWVGQVMPLEDLPKSAISKKVSRPESKKGRMQSKDPPTLTVIARLREDSYQMPSGAYT